MKHRIAAILSPVLLACSCTAAAQESQFLDTVKKYADAMIERGTDRYGDWHSPLFASVLDRDTLSLPKERPPSPGAREWDRAGVYYSDARGRKQPPLTGSNPHHDENVYRSLYGLTEITGDPKYAKAADAAIQYFFTHAQSRETGLMTWGEHLSWDLLRDESGGPERGERDPAYAQIPKDSLHEFGKDWVLWDRSYKLAPENCMRFALGLWNNQIDNRETGTFSRHARWLYHQTWADEDYPRHAGFYIRTWGDLYGLTKDQRLLKPIDVVLGRYEKKRAEDGMIRFSDIERGRRWVMPLINLSMAIDCDAVAPRVPEPLSGRLRAFAKAEDDFFLGLPHFAVLSFGKGAPKAPAGFVTCVDLETKKTYAEDVRQAYTGGKTAAMQCGAVLARYEQTRDPRYLKLLAQAADGVLDYHVDSANDMHPAGVGIAISTLLAAHRGTGEGKYLERARTMGAEAVKHFWDKGPLPRATLRLDHYESLTGAGTLALALLDLHAAVKKLKVEVPRNTIDR